jgi:hypothetical protein
MMWLICDTNEVMSRHEPLKEGWFHAAYHRLAMGAGSMSA